MNSFLLIKDKISLNYATCLMAIVAQGLEHLVVVQDVAGSNPVDHPSFINKEKIEI